VKQRPLLIKPLILVWNKGTRVFDVEGNCKTLRYDILYLRKKVLGGLLIVG
jgi:hypothetical protein